MQKTAPLDKLAKLKGLRWHGMPASDYLFARLTAADGEDAWSTETAVEMLKKGKRINVSQSTVSRWLKKEHAKRRAKENMEILSRVELEFLQEHADELGRIDEMLDVQLVLLVARVVGEDGVEEACKIIRELTGLKRAITDDRKLKQRRVEHDESVAKLKSKIEKLHDALKKHGVNKEDIDALNRATVAAVDEMIAANSQK